MAYTAFPCKGCKKREEDYTCHCTCTKYAEAMKKNEQRKRESQKQKRAESLTYVNPPKKQYLYNR